MIDELVRLAPEYAAIADTAFWQAAGCAAAFVVIAAVLFCVAWVLRNSEYEIGFCCMLAGVCVLIFTVFPWMEAAHAWHTAYLCRQHPRVWASQKADYHNAEITTKGAK